MEKSPKERAFYGYPTSVVDTMATRLTLGSGACLTLFAFSLSVFVSFVLSFRFLWICPESSPLTTLRQQFATVFCGVI